MRVMIKFAFPVDAGNDAMRSGKMDKIFQGILEELKPEAAYFFPEGGERGGSLCRRYERGVTDRGYR
jgi:hypothetical protein